MNLGQAAVMHQTEQMMSSNASSEGNSKSFIIGLVVGIILCFLVMKFN
jgi:hypothetical protein